MVKGSAGLGREAEEKSVEREAEKEALAGAEAEAAGAVTAVGAGTAVGVVVVAPAVDSQEVRDLTVVEAERAVPEALAGAPVVKVARAVHLVSRQGQQCHRQLQE